MATFRHSIQSLSSDQRRGGEALAMSDQRLRQVAENRAALQPPRLHHGEHPLHEPAPGLALAAERILPPQHPAPQYPLRVVVRRLDPSSHYEPPHRRQQRQHVLAEGCRLAIGAPPPHLESPLQGARRAVQPDLQLLPVAAAPAEQVPRHEHPLGDALQLPPQRCRCPAPIDQLLEVPLEVCPANLAAEGRQPVIDAPAIAAHEPLHLLPQQRCQSLPPPLGVDQEGRHGTRANRIKLPPNCSQAVDFVKGSGLRFSPEWPVHGGESWLARPCPSASTSPAYVTPASTAASDTCSQTSWSSPSVPSSPGPTTSRRSRRSASVAATGWHGSWPCPTASPRTTPSSGSSGGSAPTPSSVVSWAGCGPCTPDWAATTSPLTARHCGGRAARRRAWGRCTWSASGPRRPT